MSESEDGSSSESDNEFEEEEDQEVDENTMMATLVEMMTAKVEETNRFQFDIQRRLRNADIVGGAAQNKAEYREKLLASLPCRDILLKDRKLLECENNCGFPRTVWDKGNTCVRCRNIFGL